MLPAVTGLVIALIALAAFLKYRDVTHPAVFMAPFFVMFYSLWPLILNYQGDVSRILPDLQRVQILFLMVISVFFGSMLIPGKYARKMSNRDVFWSFHAFSVRDRKRLFWLAVILGVLSLYCFMDIIGGIRGFTQTYSVSKGAYASSGIIGEGILLSFPAVVLLALHCRLKGRVELTDILLAILFMAPHLMQGTLGGRRGPLFVSMVSLFLAYFVARGERPKLWQLGAIAALLPVAMIFLVVNRGDIYLGSEFNFSMEGVIAFVVPDPSMIYWNDYVFGVAQVVKADYYQDFNWGWRYFVTFFVRPIPSFLWPTKYEDVGAVWLNELDDMTYYQAIGFGVPSGASGGSIGDGYQEFSWGVIIMFALLGKLLLSAWERHRALGGKWTIALTIMLALCIYLPTQSFSAWGFRVMLATVPVFLIWDLVFGKTDADRLRRAQERAGGTAFAQQSVGAR